MFINLLLSVILVVTPYGGGVLEDLAFCGYLDKAKESVKMCAYGFTDPLIADELISLKSSGVDVRIVMDSTQAAGVKQRALVKKMRDAGIQIRIGKSPVHSQLIHAKFVVIDDKLEEDGSWNFTTNASDQVNTLNFSDDPERVKVLNDTWDAVWNHLEKRNK